MILMVALGMVDVLVLRCCKLLCLLMPLVSVVDVVFILFFLSSGGWEKIKL